MDIQTQLLKIRQKRYENAQAHLLSCRKAWRAAEQALQEAKNIVKDFSQFRQKEIKRLYDKLIGKKIMPRDLQDTRMSEANLNERLKKLQSIVKIEIDVVAEKKTLLEKAQGALAKSQKALAKAEEIYNQAQDEKVLTEIAHENNALDDFINPRRLLPILGLVIFLLPLTNNAEEKVYYRALDQNLPLVLQDIADHFDLALEMFGVPNRRIKGEYEIREPERFLKTITSRYQLDWFIKDETLFITPNTQRKRRTFALNSADQLDDFYHYLMHNKKTIGTNFPLRADAKKAVLIATAPEVYLRYLAKEHKKYLAGDTSAETAPLEKNSRLFHNPQTGYGVMIFRLEHAWAADKTYQSSSDSSYAVQGIASLLRKLTGAAEEAGKAKGRKSPVSQSLPPLPPLAAPGRALREPTASSENAAAAATAVAGIKPVIILADERLNAVLIYDDRRRYGYYKDLVRHLDRKTSLVEIEAMIVDVAKNYINDLGINWRVSKGRDSVGFGDLGETLADGALAISGGAGGLATALSGNLSGILAKINFLETKGNSRIVSRPSVVTMDNLEAVINTKNKFFVRVSGFQDSSLYPVETGTTLRVTPHIIRSNVGDRIPHIQLFIVIEDGSIDESASSAVDGVPSIQENRVSTQMVIRQGESLLVGGHIHTTKSTSVSRVPILGDLPLIGYLFKSESVVEREFIRLFIIRPRIYE